jgi:tetratricopeptide (TPR) repeat protein
LYLLLAPFFLILAGCTRPPDVVSLHASVVTAMQDGELEQARKLLDKAYGKGVFLAHPANPDTLIRSGISQADADRLRLLQSEILLEQGKAPAALDLLTYLQDPHDPESHLRWMVNRAVALNRMDEQVQSWDLLKTVELDSGNPAFSELSLKANLLRGSLLARFNKFDEAEAKYRETASIAQRDGRPFYRTAALVNLSELNLRRQRYDACVEHALQALESGDGRLAARIHNNLGIAYFRLGDLDRAEKHEAEAVTISRKSGDTHTLADALGNLANVDIEQRKFVDAV